MLRGNFKFDKFSINLVVFLKIKFSFKPDFPLIELDYAYEFSFYNSYLKERFLFSKFQKIIMIKYGNKNFENNLLIYLPFSCIFLYLRIHSTRSILQYLVVSKYFKYCLVLFDGNIRVKLPRRLFSSSVSTNTRKSSGVRISNSVDSTFYKIKNKPFKKILTVLKLVKSISSTSSVWR